MQIVNLAGPPSVPNAPANTVSLAERLRDSPTDAYSGPQPARGDRCSLCGRQSRTELFDIVLDQQADLGARIGMPNCRSYLKDAVERLLVLEEQGNHPKRDIRMTRLHDALGHLT